jgi:hypothetical protein
MPEEKQPGACGGGEERLRRLTFFSATQAVRVQRRVTTQADGERALPQPTQDQSRDRGRNREEEPGGEVSR